MTRALEDTHLAGLGHNVPFLAAVMDQDRFKSGNLSTSYIKDEFPDGFHGLKPTVDQERILIASECIGDARFFIDRPIFAWVIAIVLMLAGLPLFWKARAEAR